MGLQVGRRPLLEVADLCFYLDEIFGHPVDVRRGGARGRHPGHSGLNCRTDFEDFPHRSVGELEERRDS